jgi:hypothetical protein
MVTIFLSILCPFPGDMITFSYFPVKGGSSQSTPLLGQGKIPVRIEIVDVFSSMDCSWVSAMLPSEKAKWETLQTMAGVIPNGENVAGLDKNSKGMVYFLLPVGP